MIRCVRCSVPVSLSVRATDEEATNVSFAGTTRDGEYISVSFEGDRIDEYGLDGENYFVRFVKAVVFSYELSDNHRVNRITDPTRQMREVAEWILQMTNRFFRCLRHFAVCPHVDEIHEQLEDVDKLLALWEVEISIDGVTWERAAADVDNTELLAFLLSNRIAFTDGRANFNVRYRDDVEEAFLSGLEPPPEYQYAVNALEALNMHKIRWAIVEAVIGLDIAVARYLEAYLRSRSFPKRVIDDFLSPQLDLKRRVSVLLPSYLEESDGVLRGERLVRVLSAINARNRIVHQGKCDLSRDKAFELVTAVLEVSTYLSWKRRQLDDGPRFTEICRASLRRVLGDCFFVRVELVDRHAMSVDVTFYVTNEFPEEPVLLDAVMDLSTSIQREDPWFRPERDLVVVFKDFPGISMPNLRQAVWKNGTLRFVK